jgi:hypothetical protein
MPTDRCLAAGLLTILLLSAQPGRPARRWAMYERDMQDPADDPPMGTNHSLLPDISYLFPAITQPGRSLSGFES